MPRKKRQISDMQIRKAMARHEGHIGSMAEELGCTTATIYRRLKNNPKIREAFDDTQEKILDKCLKTVEEHVESGSLKASQYVLDNIGASRGFGSKQAKKEDEGANVGAMMFNLLDTTEMTNEEKKLLIQSLQKEKKKQLEEGK